jgi:energy-coupling factor transporter transmembrane protein EcfT
VPPRFAYGALAAYQAVPRLASDLMTIVGARRLRGVRPWHPRILIGLLVRAIRHADQLAIAMDARGFRNAARTSYREERLTPLDLAFGATCLAILVAALFLAR